LFDQITGRYTAIRHNSLATYEYNICPNAANGHFPEPYFSCLFHFPALVYEFLNISIYIFTVSWIFDGFFFWPFTLSQFSVLKRYLQFKQKRASHFVHLKRGVVSAVLAAHNSHNPLYTKHSEQQHVS